ncbi:MAG: PDZ domain-containing protein [Firmicutes bacterium]|nr:PDZ domain-containing protein [Bacillota bacterium]
MNFKELKKHYLPYVAVAVISALISSFVVIQYAQNRPLYASENGAPQAAQPVQVAVAGPMATAARALGENTIADVAERVSKAVVNIDTKRVVKVTMSDFPFFDDPFFRQFFQVPDSRPRTVPAQGSGFIIRSDGYILTNKHVIEKAKEIKVTLGDGREFDGKVVGADPLYDFAVVKINARNLPTVTLGDSDKIRPGDWAIAIGNPLGLQHTVTAGIISGLARSLEDPRETGSYIQTDAAINPGNSGGPLVNIRGEVVGINTAIIPSAQGIGFAIPINQPKAVIDDLINKGKVTRPWVGITMQELTKELADYFGLPDTQGVVVTDVVPGSPAEKHGLQRGDVLKEVDYKKITSAKQVQDLVRTKRIGDKVLFRVWRDGGYRYVTVVIGEMPTSLPSSESQNE